MWLILQSFILEQATFSVESVQCVLSMVLEIRGLTPLSLLVCHRLFPLSLLSHAVLCCPCGFQYVGRIMWALQVWLGEHIGNMRRGFRGHSVSKQFAEKHKRDSTGTIFLGIDKLIPHWKGGSIKLEITKLEMKWIYNNKYFTPLGLM